jgi:pimeloyl-ACP methyl ester carboxylesterase
MLAVFNPHLRASDHGLTTATPLSVGQVRCQNPSKTTISAQQGFYPVDVGESVSIILGASHMSTSQLFAAFEVKVDHETPAIPAFFIESTAPNNLDDKDAVPGKTPEYCVKIPTPREAVDRIAEELARQPEPKLVITVHGFNSPRDAVLETYKKSFLAVNQDTAIHGRGVVCVGYRWPSERMGTPLPSALSAAPWFLLGTLFVSLGVVYFVNFVLDLCGLGNSVRIPVTAVTAMMAIIPITLFLLRLIVYFRDVYRATTYGVPDLVDIVRLIDTRLDERQKDLGAENGRADLSFIGHSMGGFVVTNAVRILSDVFSPAAKPKTVASGVGAVNDDVDLEERSHIGKVFRLRRLVLVSPDIPAEVLLSGRANDLRSSLDRFQEAHLFSNEGDEVLRDISTTANFFTLPTKRREFGYRLGNAGVLTEWGITKGITLDKLRIGARTLAQLYDALDSNQFQDSLARRFTYFDCTDSIENGQGVVTVVQPGKPSDLSWIAHLGLLARYVFVGRPDVHSGYFEPGFVGGLIYRFACIGYGDSEEAFGKFDAFSAACKEHQVKAMRN